MSTKGFGVQLHVPWATINASLPAVVGARSISEEPCLACHTPAFSGDPGRWQGQCPFPGLKALAVGLSCDCPKGLAIGTNPLPFVGDS